MLFYYMTLLLIPFNNHPLLSYSYHGFTPIKVVGGLAFLAAVLEFLSRKGAKPFSSRQSWYFAVFSVVFLVSMSINEEYQYSSTVLFKFVSVWIFFVTTRVLLNTRKKFFISMLCVLAAMDIASLYIFKEFLAYGSIYSWFRPGGTFGDPNYFAISAAAVIPAAYFLYTVSAKGWLRRFCLISLIVYIAALALSQSRGGILAFAVIILFILYYRRFQVRTAAFMGAIVLLMAVLMPNNIIDRFRAFDSASKKSTEVRYALLESGFNMIAEHPVIGIGPGNFKVFSKDYSESIGKGQIAHNSYVELAAELGIFGLLFFVMISGRALKEASLRMAESGEDRQLRAVFTGMRVGLLGFLAGAVFLSAEYEKIFWFYVFALAASKRFLTARSKPGQEADGPSNMEGPGRSEKETGLKWTAS